MPAKAHEAPAADSTVLGDPTAGNHLQQTVYRSQVQDLSGSDATQLSKKFSTKGETVAGRQAGIACYYEKFK